MTSLQPYIQELNLDTETPVSFFMKTAAAAPYAVLLESAEKNRRAGRYSYIGLDPLAIITIDGNTATIARDAHKPEKKAKRVAFENPLTVIEDVLSSFNITPPKSFRFSGGAVGYFNYDLVRFFEPVPTPKKSPSIKIPESTFIIPKIIVQFDHYAQRTTVMCYEKKAVAKKTVAKLLEKLRYPLPVKPSFVKSSSAKNTKSIGKSNNRNFQDLCRKAKEYIAAGELLQVVISQEVSVKTKKEPFELYREMRLKNPSPYMYYLKYPSFSIVGASPETMVRVENGSIELRPIAGTRPRGANAREEKKLEKELRNDPKERAEHMMLLDLGRNDVGRFSKRGSVKVADPMHIERYSHVMHLVSSVTGVLNPNHTVFDVFRSCFPAGTLSGAPKVRAMRYVSEFEKQKRGLYGGAVGYFDFAGNMDFAIAIRTLIYKKGLVSVRAGAGIVADSIPAAEDRECAHKMASSLAVCV